MNTKFDEIKEKLDPHFEQMRGTLETETVPLLDAIRRYLAEDVEDAPGCVKGKRIDPNTIGKLSKAGHGFAEVYKFPLISLISIGDEWVSVFEEEYEDRERDVNSYMVASFVKSTGADIAGINLSQSNADSLKAALDAAMEKSNVIVIFGKDNEVNNKAIEETLPDYDKANRISIIKDTHCCCHIKNNIIFWLAGAPEEILLGYKDVVEPFIQHYYFNV